MKSQNSLEENYGYKVAKCSKVYFEKYLHHDDDDHCMCSLITDCVNDDYINEFLKYNESKTPGFKKQFNTEIHMLEKQTNKEDYIAFCEKMCEKYASPSVLLFSIKLTNGVVIEHVRVFKNVLTDKMYIKIPRSSILGKNLF